jgi:hypothetical protein
MMVTSSATPSSPAAVPCLVSVRWMCSAAVVVIGLVFLAHTLRNLTSLYLVALGLTYAGGLVCLVGTTQLPRNRLDVAALYAIFVGYSAYVAVLSVWYLGRLDIGNSLARLFVAPLVAAVWYPFLRKEADGWRLTRLYLLVFVVAVATYVYQFATGPVSWFNEPGAPRGGLARFATNLGSLTIYGTSVGVALLFVFGSRLNMGIKVILTAVFLAGCAFSMQKAAFVNVGLAAIGGLWLSGAKARLKGMAVVLVGLIVLVGSGPQLLGPNLTRYIDALTVNTVGTSIFGSDVRKDDTISSERIAERAYGMVQQDILIDHDVGMVFTMGIGVVGGGGGMGMDAPQAHNSLWDLLLMGGIGYLLLFLLLYYRIQRHLLQCGGRLARILFAANIIFLINATASSSHMFHPITSFPFWLSLTVAVRTGKDWVRTDL